MGVVKTTGRAKADVYYPESDGKSMAESDLHRDEMLDLIAMLKRRYAGVPDVYVSGNLLMYYEEVARELAAWFPGSMHVRDLGLQASDDETIWVRAAASGFLIVTKDDDFRQRSFLHGRLLDESLRHAHPARVAD